MSLINRSGWLQCGYHVGIRDVDSFRWLQSQCAICTWTPCHAEFPNDIPGLADVIDYFASIRSECTDLNEALLDEKHAAIEIADIVKHLTASELKRSSTRQQGFAEFSSKYGQEGGGHRCVINHDVRYALQRKGGS